ncbi:MAG: hypothetical protein ABIJ86_02535, partial [Spirochaetota bacterium]
MMLNLALQSTGVRGFRGCPRLPALQAADGLLTHTESSSDLFLLLTILNSFSNQLIAKLISFNSGLPFSTSGQHEVSSCPLNLKIWVGKFQECFAVGSILYGEQVAP